MKLGVAIVRGTGGWCRSRVTKGELAGVLGCLVRLGFLSCAASLTASEKSSLLLLSLPSLIAAFYPLSESLCGGVPYCHGTV